MAKLIKSILANRMMFRGGGLVPPSQAAGILASSSPLIDSVTLNQGGPVNFANGGLTVGAGARRSPPYADPYMSIAKGPEGLQEFTTPSAQEYRALFESRQQRKPPYVGSGERLQQSTLGLQDFQTSPFLTRPGSYLGEAGAALGTVLSNVKEIIDAAAATGEDAVRKVSDVLQIPLEAASNLVSQVVSATSDAISTVDQGPAQRSDATSIVPPGTVLSDFKDVTFPIIDDPEVIGIPLRPSEQLLDPGQTDSAASIARDVAVGTAKEAWRQGMERQNALLSGSFLPDGLLKDTLTQTTLGDVVDYWTSSNNADEGIVTAQGPSLTASEMLEDIQRFSPKSDMTGGPDTLAGGMSTPADFSMYGIVSSDDSDSDQLVSPENKAEDPPRVLPRPEGGPSSMRRVQKFVQPSLTEAIEALDEDNSGVDAVQGAPFNQSDAVDKLLGDIIKSINSPTGEVDEKSLREEIDALLPAIEKDPTGKALQYFLLAAQVADKGVAEGLRDGLPAMIKYRGEKKKEERQRQQNIASLVLKEKLDVRSEKRAAAAARQNKYVDYLFEEAVAGNQKDTYIVGDNVVLSAPLLKSLGYDASAVEKMGGNLKLSAQNRLYISANAAGGLMNSGVPLIKVDPEGMSADFKDYFPPPSETGTATPADKRAQEMWDSFFTETDVTVFGGQGFGSAFAVKVADPKVSAQMSVPSLALLRKLGFNIDPIVDGKAQVTDLQAKNVYGEFLRRRGFVDGLQDELASLANILETKKTKLTGVGAYKDAVGGFLRGLGTELTDELSSIFIEKGEPVARDEYQYRSHMFLARAARFLLGEEGKTISNQDRARIARAIGINLVLTEAGEVDTVNFDGFKDLIVDPVSIKVALDTTGRLLAKSGNDLNDQYVGFMESVGRPIDEKEYAYTTADALSEKKLAAQAKQQWAAYLGALTTEGQNRIPPRGTINVRSVK